MTFRFVMQTVAALFFVLGAGLLTATDANAVGVGKTCAGVGGIPCDAGLWCDPQPGKCGVADAQGKCIKVPEVCTMSKIKTKQIAYVCGCDKKDYGNNCERQVAKVALNHRGKCK